MGNKTTVLLDTNVLVWLLEGGSKLGKIARSRIDNTDVVYVSAISISELTIKAMLGKIVIPDTLEKTIEDAGLKLMTFSSAHAIELLQFPDLVRHDPFDRMLLSSAKVEGITFMTSDKFLLDLKLEYVISARR